MRGGADEAGGNPRLVRRIPQEQSGGFADQSLDPRGAASAGLRARKTATGVFGDVGTARSARSGRCAFARLSSAVPDHTGSGSEGCLLDHGTLRARIRSGTESTRNLMVRE